MSKRKIYLERESDEACSIVRSKEYCLHIDKMTGEDLHNKSEIAIELARRDIKNKELQEENKSYKKHIEAHKQNTPYEICSPELLK